MNNNEFISPEERLLRIIKGKPKKENGNEPNLADKKSLGRKRDIDRNKNTVSPNTAILHYINNGLFIFWCIVIITGFLLIRGTIFLKSPQTFGSMERVEQSVEEEKDSKKPYSYYLDIIDKHNLFKAKAGSLAGKNSAVPMASPELLENYSLSGIISGKNPQAIVIDKKTNKTYFLNKGQYLNNFKIVEIYEDKIVLELEGKEFELSI